MNKVENTQLDQTILSIEEQHKLFIADGIDDASEDDHKSDTFDITDKFFLRFLLRSYVKANDVWIVYRDGKFYKQLQPGPHFLWNWNIIWGRWQVHRVNLRTVLLTVRAKGRVKGPPLPHDAPLAANADFACDVNAQFRLACKIADIEKYLSIEKPLTVFYSSFHNIVAEIIGKLPYDQYGDWATTLRDYMKERLQGGKDDTVKLMGLQVEDVFVTAVEANGEHDRNMLAMYKLVEQARRELQEAQSNRQRDNERAQTYIEQGNLLNIAPSILALQESAIGKEFILCDTELRKLMIAVGLTPGVNIQSLSNTPSQPGQGGNSAASVLQLPHPQLPGRQSGSSLLRNYAPTGNTAASLPPGGGNQSRDAASQSVSGSLAPSTPSNASSSSYPTLVNSAGLMLPIGQQDTPTEQKNTPSAIAPATPITPVRQEQELAELNTTGFLCAGKGQHTPTFDNEGQPIAGSTEWILEVYTPRPIGYLTLIFHCPMGYPLTPPRVQVRTQDEGELHWEEPVTVREWHPGRMLAEVAQEIDESTSDWANI